MKTIIITVSPTGETQVATRGFEGSACQEASSLLEQALGARQQERLTAEFYQTQSQNEQQLERS